MAQSLQGQELRLHRDEQPVAGCQPVQREDPQRRRTVNKDIVEIPTDLCQRPAQKMRAIVAAYQLNLGARQILIGGQDK